MDLEPPPYSCSSKSLSVGFIGAGMMASSLADGLVSKKVVESPSCISCSDVVSFFFLPVPALKHFW
jgi:hypothetical protein